MHVVYMLWPDSQLDRLQSRPPGFETSQPALELVDLIHD